MNLKWIELILSMVQLHAFVLMIMNFRVA